MLARSRKSLAAAAAVAVALGVTVAVRHFRRRRPLLLRAVRSLRATVLSGGGGGGPPPRVGFGFGGGLRLFGGLSLTDGNLNDLWQLRLPSGEWERVQPAADSAPPPAGRAYPAVAALDEGGAALLVFGGVCNGFDFRNDLHLFRDGRWAALHAHGEPPPERCAAAAAVDPASGDVYVFGGVGRQMKHFSDVWALRGVAQGRLEWERLCAAAPIERRRSAALVLRDGQLLVFGGKNAAGAVPVPDGFVDAFDLASRTWKSVSTTGASPQNVSGALLDADGRVAVAGGAWIDGAERLVVHYLVGTHWARATVTPTVAPRLLHGFSCSGAQGGLVVVGGEDSGDAVLEDVVLLS